MGSRYVLFQTSFHVNSVKVDTDIKPVKVIQPLSYMMVNLGWMRTDPDFHVGIGWVVVKGARVQAIVVDDVEGVYTVRNTRQIPIHVVMTIRSVYSLRRQHWDDLKEIYVFQKNLSKVSGFIQHD